MYITYVFTPCNRWSKSILSLQKKRVQSLATLLVMGESRSLEALQTSVSNLGIQVLHNIARIWSPRQKTVLKMEAFTGSTVWKQDCLLFNTLNKSPFLIE